MDAWSDISVSVDRGKLVKKWAMQGWQEHDKGKNSLVAIGFLRHRETGELDVGATSAGVGL